MDGTRFREWRFPVIAGKKARWNQGSTDAKNYSVIEYKTLKGSWSKPVRVGSIKFKKMLLEQKLDIKEFPQYKISKQGNRPSYVYFDQNNLRSVGKSIKGSVLAGGSEDNDKRITYTLTFYAQLQSVMERMGGRKGFRLDRYSANFVMIDGQKAYPLFHRSFHINSTKEVLRKFLRRFANPWKLSNNTAYQYFWDKFIPWVGGQNAIGVDRGALDSIRGVAYGMFNNIRELTDQEVEQLDYRLAVAMDDRFMNCRNFLQKTSPHEKYIYPLYPEDSHSYFPKNGCFYREFMSTYKPCMEKRNKTRPSKKLRNFCYAELWKIVHPDKDLPVDDDYDAWGICWNDMIKIFRFYRIEATLYDVFDDKPRLRYHPSEDGLTIDEHMTPRHFRFVWSNNHIWVVDKNGNQDWSQKLKNKKEDLKELSSKVDIDLTTNHTHPIPYGFYHLKRKNDDWEYLLIDSVEEIYAFLQHEDEMIEKDKYNQYKIITNLDIEKVFLTLRQEYDLQASIDMRGGSVNSLSIRFYYNKHVIIQQAYNPSTAQCIIHDIQDYSLMSDYLTRAKKLLLTPQYASVYNDQVFDVFQKFKKGGIVCCFDFNKNPECMFENENGDFEVENPKVGCSDYNRFYISELLSLRYFPVFNVDDYFVDYDGGIIEDLNLYCVRKIGEEFAYPFYKDDLCFGINLKKCPVERYTILKYIRPSSFRENPLHKLFEEIYDSDLPDDLKKNIGNILCGWLVQKSINTHRSFFSENRQEIEVIRREIGGMIYPLSYKGKEVGHAFTKCFSKPLLSGFYFLGLLLLDGTHWRMSVLKEQLDECGLDPFAIKTDCIYHSTDPEKYALFKDRHPEYFNYTDKNRYDALGKLKYDEVDGGLWNDYDRKSFDFVWEIPPINEVEIKNEWETDEFVDALQKHRTLLLTGHGGYGKSSSVIRACKKMGKKLLILVRMHPLADEWFAKNEDGYEVMTAESFFRLNPYSDIPFGNIATNILNDKYAVMIDDGLLCHLKIWNQWIFFQKWCAIHKPDLRLIGTIDHLQLNMLLNDDNNSFRNFAGNRRQKVLDFCCRIFQNVIRLKENKRLKSSRDRELNKEYIRIICEGDIDRLWDFRKKHMNVVANVYDIPMSVRKNLRNFIVAENRERYPFNKMAYAFEYGQYTSKWQVGHVVMANVGNNKNDEKNKYSSFQIFRIVSIQNDVVKLKNIKRGNHSPEIPMETLQRHFEYPFARTCHSWQGMTCEGKLAIYGSHHNYIGLDWQYTSESRPQAFKDIWIIHDPKDVARELDRRNFIQKKIDGYVQQDLNRGFVLDMSKYIDVAWVELECRRSEWKCHYCQENIFEGWTIDRLNSGLPHYTFNCHLCCLRCNRLKK